MKSLLAASQPWNVEVSYAAKAFATVEFLRHLASQPIGVDVCSLGELITAERAGFGPERITLHGAGKSREELTAACEGRIGLIAVDGIEELTRLAEIARGGRGVDVVLRLNVGVEADTHAYVRTAGHDTKFGIHPRDESTAAALLRENGQLRYRGLHTHIGSQIYETSTYLEAAAALVEAAARFAGWGFAVERVIVGGGFGVPSDPEEGRPLDVAAAISAVARRVAEEAGVRSIPVPRLGIEPGRAIVAAAGTTLYTVLAVKRQSRRTFVVVDGGIAENPRPALYGARYRVVPVSSLREPPQEMTLCGRSCENDELGTVSLPGDVHSGALLAMLGTGAYTYSMAGNYNRFPRPAVAGVAGGTARLLARRERVEEVLGRDGVA